MAIRAPWSASRASLCAARNSWIVARGRRGVSSSGALALPLRLAARCTAPPGSGAGCGRSLRGHPSPPCPRHVTARAHEVSCASTLSPGPRLRAPKRADAAEPRGPRPEGCDTCISDATPRLRRASKPRYYRTRREAPACSYETRWEGGCGYPLRERPEPAPLRGGAVHASRKAKRQARAPEEDTLTRLTGAKKSVTARLISSRQLLRQ